MAIVEFDPQLIKRYDKAGPRYTSYPTAVQFKEDYTPETYKAFAAKSNLSGKALSLYFHIPFCDTVCFYCGCNKVVTKDRSKGQPYMDRVFKEIEMLSGLFDPSRKVDQLHWGGGTPTFISHDEMRQLMAVTRKYFNLHDDDSGEYSIELYLHVWLFRLTCSWRSGLGLCYSFSLDIDVYYSVALYTL